MRIEIEIPKEFEEHFKQDKFKDSFERIMADIKHSLEDRHCLCAGRYEYETIKMLQEAFENSRKVYSVDKAIKELKERARPVNDYWVWSNDETINKDNAIEIVKQDSIEKET